MAKKKSTKKSAPVARKRLANNRNNRNFLTRTRIMRYGFRNFSRNAWLTIAATLIMTITLLIIFATFVASLILNETITAQRQKMDISIYFKAETKDDILRNLSGKLRIIPNVASVNISTSEDEYSKAVNMNGDDPAYIEALSIAAANGEAMQLPAVIHVKLKDTENRSEVDKIIKNDEQFQEWMDKSRSSSDDVQIRQNTIDRLSNVMSFAQKIGIGAAIIFVVISILVIFNTIRMAIFSRREEIDMMKAIGADQNFIRGPFLIEAELYGIIAAVIATAVGYFVIIKVFPMLGQYIEVAGTQKIVTQWFGLILIAMVILGLLIGYISSRLAVRRYLKS